MNRLIGFTTLTNVGSLGYPFLESIYSHLNVVDEMVIAEDATDALTKNALIRISKNKRIKIFKLSWDFSTKNVAAGRVVGDAFERTLKWVKNNYDNKSFVFDFQSNEIIHENSYGDINIYVRDAEYPQDSGLKAFLVPYNLLCGNYVNTFADERIRIAKLSAKLSIRGDGTQFSVGSDSIKSDIIDVGKALSSSIINKDFYNKIGLPFVYNIMPLPIRPIFRYGVIFKNAYMKKLQNHMEAWSKKAEMYKKAFEFASKLKNCDNQDDFYKSVAEYKMPARKMSLGHPLSKPQRVESKYHPKIIRDILMQKDYRIRESVIKQILELR